MKLLYSQIGAGRMAKTDAFTFLHCFRLVFKSFLNVVVISGLQFRYVQLFFSNLFRLLDFSVKFAQFCCCFRREFKGSGQFSGSAGVNRTRPSTSNLIMGSQPLKVFLSWYEPRGLDSLQFS